jgi:hypothetical protein
MPYTIHKNKLKQQSYLARHRPTENWNDPHSAGALSRWLLWNTPSLNKNVELFKERFGLN